jgi:FkbM family methyltransferase
MILRNTRNYIIFKYYIMFDKLITLKNKGYIPDTVLDIGAYHGNWTLAMKHIYNSSDYYLFEAIDYPELNRFGTNSNITKFNVLLNDKTEEVNWYQMKNTGDSIFREKTYHFDNCDIIKRQSTTLDTFILQKNILNKSKNIFIKIDCQGAEIPILKGSSSILERTDFIILEMPLFGQYNENVPSFLEHIKYMDSIGFIPYDILENHIINNFNMQVDMLFINKKHEFNNIVGRLLHE